MKGYITARQDAGRIEAPPASRKTILALLLLIPCTFSAVCAGGSVVNRENICDEVISEKGLMTLSWGWCGDTAFRHRATGSTRASITNIEERKESSLGMAIANARKDILQKLKDYRIEAAGDYYWRNELPLYEKHRKEVRATIRAGRVVASAWDEQQNCVIIYEVKRVRLKELVQATRWPD